jgi:hypothetical protein
MIRDGRVYPEDQGVTAEQRADAGFCIVGV